VYDPEIPINVYDMGLIYKIGQNDEGDVYVEMTLTAPTCPIAGVLPQQVADAIAQTNGVGKVEVKLVWEPAWTPDKMTEEAKAMLELL
jgi:FeS assembly SUF system protein